MVERRGGYVPDPAMRSEHTTNKMYKNLSASEHHKMREKKPRVSRLYKDNNNLFAEKFDRELLATIEAEDLLEDFLVFIYDKYLDEESQGEFINFVVNEDVRSIKGVIIAIARKWTEVAPTAKKFLKDIHENNREIDWKDLRSELVG